MDNLQDFSKRVYEIAADVPPGSVITYGALALLAGRPGNSRLVGRLMSGAPKGVPAHRVVNFAGRTVPGWMEQRALLERENVTFKENGCVNLKKHIWKALNKKAINT